MKKYLILLVILVVGFTTNAQNVVFEHGFETPTGNGFETGWTTIPTPGGNTWSREPHWATDLIANSCGLGRYARILYHNTVAHNAWLITPGIPLVQGKLYKISFLLFTAGQGSVYEKLEFKIGNSATPTGLSHLLFETGATTDYHNQTITADYIPTVTGNYYIGWHACSPANGNFIMIDDILVVEVAGDDLENITKYSFSQVPVSQTLPPGKVVNIGAAAQTNVKLTAQINGAPVGASAPLASLAAGATAELPLMPPVYVPEGQNTMVYTITQDQPDINPDNNVCTFNYKGTKNVFALDDVIEIEFAPSIIHSEIQAYGNIFTITQPVTLSQVILGFGAMAPLDFNILLYSMTGELTTATTPIFTHPTVREGFGFFPITVPATPLTPGSYFICATMESSDYTHQPYLSFDGNPAKVSYGRNNAGGLIRLWEFGGATIRLVLTVTDCDAPTNLSVIQNFNSATFSWEGTATLYKLVINDGTTNLTLYTPNKSMIVWGLQEDTPYTWNLTSICDATHNSATITGPPFTTLACSPNNFSLPFFEGFESPLFPPSCWKSYNVGGTPSEWERSMWAHTGKFGAHHFENIINAKEGWFVTPQIHIPNEGNYVFEFWSVNDYTQYHSYSGIWISTTDGDPTTSTFTEIKELKGSEISDVWQKITIPLTALGYAGKTIYIGFKYASNEGDDGDRWFIDDISIANFSGAIDGELVSIVSPSTGEGLTTDEAVKILIKNNGSNPLTNFSVTVKLNGDLIATETYSGSIPSFGQVEYIFDGKLNLSAFGAYDITATLDITGDVILENNSKTKKIGNFSSKIVKLYGNKTTKVTEPRTEGFVSFYSNNPAELSLISDYKPAEPANSLVAGEHVNGYIYAYPTEWIENYGYLGVSFVKISTETWTEVSSSAVSAFPLEMTYDYSSNTMYGVIAPNALGTGLYKINMENGAMTEVGLLGGKLAAMLACSPQGNLYMVDSKGDFCSINKTTGAATVIGHTGIKPYHKQSMAFDRNTGRLFWAMNNFDAESKLLEIDLASGLVFDRGDFAGNAAIVGLYSVLGDIGISDNKLPAFSIYPNPANNELQITIYELRNGLLSEVEVEIYDVYGRKVLSNHLINSLSDQKIDISSLSSGVYFVRLAGNKTNSVQKFIKQ